MRQPGAMRRSCRLVLPGLCHSCVTRSPAGETRPSGSGTIEMIFVDPTVEAAQRAFVSTGGSAGLAVAQNRPAERGVDRGVDRAVGRAPAAESVMSAPAVGAPASDREPIPM